MSAHDIWWDPARTYAAFVSHRLGIATIVSSAIADRVEGVSVGPVLFVIDEDRCVCDVEVRTNPTRQDRVIAPSLGERQHRSGWLRTSVAWEAGGSVDVSDDWLTVSFTSEEAGQWVHVGDAPLYMRLDGHRLVAIATSFLVDEDGALEAEWIDEVEQA